MFVVSLRPQLLGGKRTRPRLSVSVWPTAFIEGLWCVGGQREAGDLMAQQRAISPQAAHWAGNT